MQTQSPSPTHAGHRRRQALLNLKSLFWCLHQIREQYDLQMVMHSLQGGVLHPQIANTHLGDNVQFLIDSFDAESLEQMQSTLVTMQSSRASMDVGEKHFEVGHYIQAVNAFGPIAQESYGVISSITPELRGLFYLEGAHLMQSTFAPSDVRVIFGTYIV